MKSLIKLIMEQFIVKYSVANPLFIAPTSQIRYLAKESYCGLVFDSCRLANESRILRIQVEGGTGNSSYFECTVTLPLPSPPPLPSAIKRLKTFVLLSSFNVDSKEDQKDDGIYEDKNPTKEDVSVSSTINEEQISVKNRTDKVRDIVKSALKMTEKREQIGQVIPIIRNMSVRQKLLMARLISKRINDNETTPSSATVDARSLFGDNDNNRRNASRALMLPISADIARIISDDISGDEMEEDEEEEMEEDEVEKEEVEKNEKDEDAKDEEEGKEKKKDEEVKTEKEKEEEEEDGKETAEELPKAQELRSARPVPRRRPFYRMPPPPPVNLSTRRPSSLNRRNVYADPPRTSPLRPSRKPSEPKRVPTDKECTFFSKTVCLEATDYPHEAITRSLRNNKDMVSALLTDYKVQEGRFDDHSSPSPFENRYENRFENRYESNEIKRSDNSFDNVEEGFTCPSTVKYARPQLARAASGIWKYIINTGEHTQTLRLEKCSNTRSSCSFISENYRSSCVQVYNYHRLLTWDSKLGLHMDIFKVPTCCSCHVHGYSEIFPPHEKDPPPKPKEKFPGAEFVTNNESKDDYPELSKPNHNYVSKYNNPSPSYDSNIGLSSNKRPVIETSSTSRPSFTLPGRTRAKGPSSVHRPFDKLPQQHAPNTRAPGYIGPLNKGHSSRPTRHRPPFRRESLQMEEFSDNPNNSSLNRYSQPYDQDTNASTRLQNGGFDEEYHEPPRRINYNYHPILDFFKPEASMLQSSEIKFPLQLSDVPNDSNSWKPMLTS
ncbi:hypothetical protein HZH66_004578 [Vespula vulgaris]|uniref:Protein spaetzle n=1 Tax=Vespula vulgaris TaxID=7454 RepID=A0A834KAP7_VESVU|nr:hypothetical protein HZH66_004578 [Vespula vulgaris]